MCTLIALFKTHPAAPLVLALNRDELLARPTEPVHRWSEPPIVAGRDVLAGGTWFAVGERVVAGLTNHRTGMASPRGGRSRGDLVVRAAAADNVDEVASWLGDEPGQEYGGFHLLVCDGEELRCFTNRDGGDIAEEPAGPGVHVLGNLGIDDPTDPVVTTVRPAAEAAAAKAASEEELVEELQGILRRHGEGWPCVHYGPYGTRMSAVLLSRPAQPRLWLADGPSCETPWSETSELLAG
jgi:uncharacterized protein with NRDE domain